LATVGQLMQERRVRKAALKLTRAEILDELKLAYMDTCRHQMQRIGWSLARQYYSPRDRCFIQCVGHKMKNFVQNIASLVANGETAVLNAKVLMEVAQELSVENPRYSPLVAALTKMTDMQGEMALCWLLICPAFLDRLRERGHEAEYTVLEAVGMGFLAYDMPGLDQETRTVYIELINALLVYNIAGDQMFMPFFGGEKRKQTPGTYRGVREAKMQNMPSTNLLAMIANANVRAELRKDVGLYAELCELSFNQRDVENYFSQLAQQLGYKPPARMLEIKSQQADWSTQIMYEDDLGFIHRRRRDTKYKQEMKAFSRGKLSNILAWQNRSAIGAAWAVAKMARERGTGAARGRCTPTRRPVASRRRLARPQERVLRVWAGGVLQGHREALGARRARAHVHQDGALPLQGRRVRRPDEVRPHRREGGTAERGGDRGKAARQRGKARRRHGRGGRPDGTRWHGTEEGGTAEREEA